MSEERSKASGQSNLDESAFCLGCFSPGTHKMDNQEKKLGRILPDCNHNLCERCIIADRTNNGQADCGHSEFSSNIMWNSDMDLFTQLAATDRHSLPLHEDDAKLGLQCEECDDRDALCWCENCDVNLCSQCFDNIHKNSKTLSRHKASTIQAKNNLQDKVDLGKETLPRISNPQLKLNSEIKNSSDDSKEENKSNKAKSTTAGIKEHRETTTMNSRITTKSSSNNDVQELPLNQAQTDFQDSVSIDLDSDSVTSPISTDPKTNKSNPPSFLSINTDTIEQKSTGQVANQDMREQIVHHKQLYEDDHSEIPTNVGGVFISHIVNPGKFFIQKIADFEKVIQLNESSKVQDTSDGRNTRSGSLEAGEVGRGDLVLARFSATGEMYRAIITSIIQVNPTPRYNIQFIDYGISDLVELCDLKKPTPRQLRTPPLATECSLYDVSPMELSNVWSEECIEAFKDLALNKTLQVFERRCLGVVSEVDLCMQPEEELRGELTSINDILIYRKLARFTSHPNCKFYGAEPQHFLASNILEKGNNYKVMVSDIVDPAEFSIQVVAIEEDRSWGQCVEKLFDDLQESYNSAKSGSLWPVFDPKVGTVCVAKYSGDGFYYRAEVVRLLPARQVEVNFVDFGNSEVTDWSKLRTLFKKFEGIPRLSVKVALADIEPLFKNGFSRYSIKAFDEVTYAKEMLMYVEEVEDKNNPNKVVLYETTDDKNICINAWMAEKKLVKAKNSLYRVEYPKETFEQEIEVKKQQEPRMKSLSERALQLAKRRDEEEIDAYKDDIKYDENCNLIKHSSLLSWKPFDQSDEDKCSATIRNKEKRKDVYYRVTNVVSPSRIYVCSVNDWANISSLNSDLSLFLLQNRSVKSNSRQVGSWCAARLDSSTWGRAKIVGLNRGNQVTVFFCDNGDTQEVHVGQLKDLPEQFIKVPPFAKQVHLSDVRPTTGDSKWSAQVCGKLKELLLYENRVTVLDDGELVVEDSLHIISRPVIILIWESVEKGPLEPLEWKQFSVSDKLVNLELALPTENPGPVKEALFVPENLGHLFTKVSLIAKVPEEKLEDTSDEMNFTKAPDAKTVSQSCLLLGESSIAVENISLSLVDAESPCLGIVEKSSASTPQASENEACGELEKKEWPFPPLTIPYSIGEEFPVLFLGQLSQDLFYGQLRPDHKYPSLQRNQEEFNKMMEYLQSVGELQPVVSEPSAGLPVIAQYTEDRKWYRAVVTCELPLTVFFVDFGNNEQVEEVRNLPDGMDLKPEQAILFKFVTSSETDQKEMISGDGMVGCRLIQRGETPTVTKPMVTVELTTWEPEESSVNMKKTAVTQLSKRQENEK